jgi:hypothetical protein
MFQCKYCNAKFTKESTLSVHMCEPKRRYQQKDERFVQLAFRSYQHFYKQTMSQAVNERSYDNFAKSRYYTAFTKFGRYLVDVNVIDPTKYVDYLCKHTIKIDRWHLDSVYETYVKEHNKKEEARTAIERAILIMKRWEDETGNPWNLFLEQITPNRAVHYIRCGKISPWILYNSKSGVKLLQSFNAEQVALVNEYIDPDFWTAKFQMASQDVKFVEDVLEKAGI